MPCLPVRDTVLTISYHTCSRFKVYYCKTHTYLILLNRQRNDKPDIPQASGTKVPSAFRPVNKTHSHSSPNAPLSGLPRGRPVVLTSAAGILTAFLYFYTRAPASLVSWTIAQQAFNSSMLLLLDALETGNFGHVRKVEHTYVVFRELQDNNVHKLASLAVEKLSWGLDQLRAMTRGNDTLRPGEETNAKLTAQMEKCNSRECSRDTMMGNTGMLLLEEQGLQSYTTERFAPFMCHGTDAVSEATTPSILKEEQDSQFYGFANLLADEKSKRSNKTLQILEGLQDGAGSVPSVALERHFAPPSQKVFQLQSSVTGPASPISPAASVAGQDRNEAGLISGHYRHQSRQSLYSQHSKWDQNTPPSNKYHDERPDSGTGGCSGTQFNQARHHLASTPSNHKMSVVSNRHNSCPAPHAIATTPPFLRPSYSSPLEDKVHSPAHDERHDVHAQWSANHAAPMLDSIEPGMVITPMTEQGHFIRQIRHQNARQQHVLYQYPFSNDAMAPSATEHAATIVEQMKVDEWKLWVEGGAHG